MQAKTGVEGPEQARMVREMVREYVRGLCWVMRYYYEGGSQPALVVGSLSECLHVSQPNVTSAVSPCKKYLPASASVLLVATADALRPSQVRFLDNFFYLSSGCLHTLHAPP